MFFGFEVCSPAFAEKTLRVDTLLRLWIRAPGRPPSPRYGAGVAKCSRSQPSSFLTSSWPRPQPQADDKLMEKTMCSFFASRATRPFGKSTAPASASTTWVSSRSRTWADDVQAWMATHRSPCPEYFQVHVRLGGVVCRQTGPLCCVSLELGH